MEVVGNKEDNIVSHNQYKVDVLDRGYIRLSRIMADILPDGSLRAVQDTSVADDARVSFAKRAEMFPEEHNQRLVKFLGREEHTSPFRGCIVQFEVKAPMFVRNQWYKYVIGSHHEDAMERDSFFQWNEESRRYVTHSPEFYIPKTWRSMPENRKQGSGGPVPDNIAQWATKLLEGNVFDMTQLYHDAINNGICAEQARLFLPAYGMYTTWRWTASLQTVCHFLRQRLAADAQEEIQEYAKAVYQIIHQLFPVAVDNLLGLNAEPLAEQEAAPAKV